MTNGSQEGAFRAIFVMPRFAPAWFAVLLAGLMLLFIKELPENCRTYMVPSVVIYALGAAILGAIHRLLGINYAQDGNNEKPIPRAFKVGLWVVHLLWFVALVAYNFWRDVL